VTAGTKAERNAAAEPQTEARRLCGTSRMLARDEGALCEAERAWSSGRKGPTESPCSETKNALVTAELNFVQT
jgi:hypothetical protein